MHVKKYIEQLEEEIDGLVREEAKGISLRNEEVLHILFENKKHAECMLGKHDTAALKSTG